MRGALTPTATFGVRVNGVQYWQAKMPSDGNLNQEITQLLMGLAS